MTLQGPTWIPNLTASPHLQFQDIGCCSKINCNTVCQTSNYTPLIGHTHTSSCFLPTYKHRNQEDEQGLQVRDLAVPKPGPLLKRKRKAAHSQQQHFLPRLPREMFPREMHQENPYTALVSWPPGRLQPTLPCQQAPGRMLLLWEASELQWERRSWKADVV